MDLTGLGGSFAEGIATRSKHRIAAPRHILVLTADGYRTWCTGASAIAETALGQPCRACLALLRELHQEG